MGIVMGWSDQDEQDLRYTQLLAHALTQRDATRDATRMQQMVDALNFAFASDPQAIAALFTNRMPCNQDLADGPHMVVKRVLILSFAPFFTVGALGVLNGCLHAAGLPDIVSRWSEPDESGIRQLLGFGVAQTSPATRAAT